MKELQISNIVDTSDLQFQMYPFEEIKHKIKSKLVVDNTTEYGIGGVYFGKHSSGLYSFQYICAFHLLIVKLSHKAIMRINDWKQLQQNVLDIVTSYFGLDITDIKPKNSKVKNSRYIPLVEVNRTDYKIDSSYNNNEEKLIIQDIMRIAPATFNGYEQITYEYTDNEGKIDRINVNYCKEQNSYISMQTYFKGLERAEKGDAEGAKKYENIVRSEIQIHNKHLNYQKRNRSKTLSSYYNIDTATSYLSNNFSKIYYTEDFYNLDLAISIIMADKEHHLKEFMKKRICDFLTKINEVGISEAKKEYSIDTFRKYVKIVRGLGINPLCFSSEIDGVKIGIGKIKNFAIIENNVNLDK